METIKLLYVDDNTDPYISQYLYEEYGYEGVSIEYLQRPFEPEDTYESLLSDRDVHFADIIITQTSHPKSGHKACINAGWDTNQLIS